jgi:hypothetical protein
MVRCAFCHKTKAALARKSAEAAKPSRRLQRLLQAEDWSTTGFSVSGVKWNLLAFC